ncbi:MAG: helix-turn-helix domain-containing protein [Psychrosphaera sp.]|nr:helix-turn-helix domain-containing protein [Psychrosphaera sp.]
MHPILEQIKQRRKSLALKQHDMMMRVGISRQQYQRLESKGNPRLDTLDLVSKGLNCELMLIPKEKLSAVKAILANEDIIIQSSSHDEGLFEENELANDPWKGLLPSDE